MQTMYYRSHTDLSNYYSPAIRLFLVRSFSALLFLALAVRLVYVQGIQKFSLQQRADRQLPVENASQNLRHVIFDRSLSPLAETVPIHSCYVDPRVLRDPSSAARTLADTFGMNGADLLGRIKKAKGSFLWIKRDVPAPLVEAIKAKKLPGVGFRVEKRRHYPMGPLASHLLGLVGYDGNGLSGVELGFDSVLDVEGKEGRSIR